MMDERNIDKLIEQALKEEQALPEGLADRLSQKIDLWEENERQARSRKRTLFLYAASTAAAVFLAFHVAPSLSLLQRDDVQMADTYSDPEEAAAAAQKALVLLSANLNKGIKQATASTQEMNRIENVVINQLK